jgi:hypothetical protein
MEIRIVRNSKGRTCSNCTGVHEHLSRPSKDARCGTPVAFSEEKARRMARLFAGGDDDVERVPNDTIVIIDDSARSLPRGTNAVVTALDQEKPTLVRAG